MVISGTMAGGEGEGARAGQVGGGRARISGEDPRRVFLQVDSSSPSSQLG